MRNYWLRIAIGAFALFGAGMLVWNVFDLGKRKVERAMRSSDPITVPLAFVPFTVNGTQLGTLRRVQLERSAPDRVTAIKFRVKLADSVTDARFADCMLIAGGRLEDVSNAHTFACIPGADTVGRALEQIGEIETQGGGTFPLLGEAGTLEGIHLDFANDAMDSLGEAAAAQADSISALHEARGDSIARHLDSVMQDLEPRIKRQVEEAQQRAQAAADRARRGAVVVEAPAAPTPPAKP
jgi:hypothetical protein